MASEAVYCTSAVPGMIVPLDKGKCECGWALVRRGTNKTGTNQLTGWWLEW